MSGLVDATTGLAYGTGLQSQTPIGSAGLITPAAAAPGGGGSLDFSVATNSMYLEVM